MNIHDYLNMDYNDLIDLLFKMSDSDKECLLKNHAIKFKIINPNFPQCFFKLIQNIGENEINYLLDDYGVSLLQEMPNVAKYLDGLIISKHLNKALKSKNLCQLILDNINNIKAPLSCLNIEGAGYLFSYIVEEKVNSKETLIYKLSEDVQLSILKQNIFDSDKLRTILLMLSNESIDYILNNYLDPSLIDNYSYEMFEIMSQRVCIPSFYLYNSKIIKRIGTIFDSIDYREFINALEKKCDVSKIEEYRQHYYDMLLNSYDQETKMIKPFKDLYDKALKNMENNEKRYIDLDGYFGNSNTIHAFNTNLNNAIFLGKEKVYEFLKEESDLEITNIIIDSNFQDIYYNFLKDLAQMMNIDCKYNIFDKETKEIYASLLKIDNLTFEEKMSLHRKLQASNMIVKYYDDMKKAKNKSFSEIRNSILNEDKLIPFKCPSISESIGINVYKLDGEEFFALVKALSIKKTIALNQNDLIFNYDAGSFSLIGDENISTFRDPSVYYTFMYSDFDIENVVHTFRNDSYSNYSRDNGIGTLRIFELHTPKSLVRNSLSYNEIVIAMRNERRNDEINNKITNPKVLGIVCYDEINENDIETARNLGIAIVLIKTKNYKVHKQIMVDSYCLDGSYSDNNYYTSNVLDKSQINRRSVSIKKPYSLIKK